MSSASDKLTETRGAILDHIHRRDRRREEQPVLSELHEHDNEPWGLPAGDGDGSGWFSRIKRAAHTWWRYHPAHMAVELATPALASYARAKPVQLLGIVAGVGVVLVLARPWRLISLTGLAVALVKSSQLSSVLLSALSAADFQKDSQRPE